MTVILASASPRRHEILNMAGIKHTVLISGTDESIPDGTSAADMVRILSERKAAAVLRDKAELDRIADGRAVVIAADTVVTQGGEIFGKPHDKNEAHRMLRRLSSETHTVLTGITLSDGHETVCEAVETMVTMRHISEREISEYIATGSPFDKAGAYGIQDMAGKFVERIDGDYYNVVGLPICRVSEILRERFGY